MPAEYARRHEHSALRAPVVHDHDGVDIGARPHLDFTQVVLVHPPQQFDQLRGLLRQVHHRLLHRAEEAEPFERAHERAGQGERAAAAAERPHGVGVDAEHRFGRTKPVQVGPVGDQRLVDDADDAAVDIVEPAAPLVDVEAFLVAAAGDRQGDTVQLRRRHQVVGEPRAEARHPLRVPLFGPRQHPRLPRHPGRLLEAQRAADQLARGHEALPPGAAGRAGPASTKQDGSVGSASRPASAQGHPISLGRTADW